MARNTIKPELLMVAGVAALNGAAWLGIGLWIGWIIWGA